MGGWMTTLFKSFDTTEEIKLLMLGLDGAGKTTVLYRLKLGEVVPTLPTIGFNVDTIEYKNLRFNSWDVGGQKKIRMLWHHYFEGTRALIFVIDSNDRSRIDEAREELWSIISDDALAHVPVLVLVNKQDLPKALSPGVVAEQLEMGKMKDRHWHVQGCNGVTGDGLHAGLDWMADTVKRVRKERS